MSTVKVVERVDPREIRRKLGLNQQQFWSKNWRDAKWWFALREWPQHAKAGT